jgi:hypothetical protein
MFPWLKHRKHPVYHPTYDGDRRRYESFMPFFTGLTAIGSVLSGGAAVKSAFTEPPQPQPIPQPKPAAVMPVRDAASAKFAAQREMAARQGKRADTFLTGRQNRLG